GHRSTPVVSSVDITWGNTHGGVGFHYRQRFHRTRYLCVGERPDRARNTAVGGPDRTAADVPVVAVVERSAFATVARLTGPADRPAHIPGRLAGAVEDRQVLHVYVDPDIPELLVRAIAAERRIGPAGRARSHRVESNGPDLI